MKGFMALRENFTLGGFKYEVGKTYNSQDYKGRLFPFCNTPLSIMKWYSPIGTIYVEIDVLGLIKNADIPDAINLTDKLKVIKVVSLEEMVELLYSHSDTKSWGDYRFALTNKHNNIASTPDSYKKAITIQKGCCASTSGIGGISYTHGQSSIAVTTGRTSSAEAHNKYSVACVNGAYSDSHVTNSFSIAIAGSINSVATAGTNSIAVAMPNCVAQGNIGSWLLLTEERNGKLDCELVYVDGTIVSDNVAYTLRNGEIIQISLDPNDY